MNKYRISEADDYGRPVTSLGIVRAGTDKEALKFAGEYYKNPEIFTTGYYCAEEITDEQLSKGYSKEYDILVMRYKILNPDKRK